MAGVRWRAVCGQGGSPLYSRLEAKPEALRLRLGASDTLPKDIAIEAIIFADDPPSWAELEGARRYPGREVDCP